MISGKNTGERKARWRHYLLLFANVVLLYKAWQRLKVIRHLKYVDSVPYSGIRKVLVFFRYFFSLASLLLNAKAFLFDLIKPD